MSARTPSARPVGRMDAPGPVVSRATGQPIGPKSPARPVDLSWQDSAACRADRLRALGLDRRIFFPLSFVADEELAGIAQARAVCVDLCPVRAQCLRYAVETKCFDGIFAGLDPAERRAAARNAARAATAANRVGGACGPGATPDSPVGAGSVAEPGEGGRSGSSAASRSDAEGGVAQ